MVLRVDPEELEAQAGKIETLASQFGIDLDTEKGNVEAMDWDGQSREAFITMFEEARTQFKDVEEQIANIALLLRSAKDGLIDADEYVAAGIRG
jgi:WXG100 family type VII secretion target